MNNSGENITDELLEIKNRLLALEKLVESHEENLKVSNDHNLLTSHCIEELALSLMLIMQTIGMEKPEKLNLLDVYGELVRPLNG